MENASKALLMAGGVLIGVLIISLAVYLFVDFGTISAQINTQNSDKQLAEFNSKFTAYENYKDKDGNWQITIYDIITLAGYAKENNNYYEGVDEEKISVKIGNMRIENYSNYNSLISEYTSERGILTTFECLSISYNNRGKVNGIVFQIDKE